MRLFRHIFVRSLDIDVVHVRDAAQLERDGIGDTKRRNVGQWALLRAVVGPHPRGTAFHGELRQNLPFGLGIHPAEEGIRGTILETG